MPEAGDFFSPRKTLFEVFPCFGAQGTGRRAQEKPAVSCALRPAPCAPRCSVP